MPQIKIDLDLVIVSIRDTTGADYRPTGRHADGCAESLLQCGANGRLIVAHSAAVC